MDPAGVGTAADELAVDVLIPNYNYAAYLGDAIESALAQTHSRIRTIVVDDGSTDGSRDVLDRYSGRVEAVLKENGGQGSALNAGLERCTGDVVMLLDSDDVLKPDAAGIVAAAFAAEPHAVKVQFRMDVIDASSRPTGEVHPAGHIPMPSGDVRRAELSFPFDLLWMATSGNAFRRAALRRIVPLPEPDYRVCADWYLVHMAALLGPVVSLDHVGSSRRLHGDNLYEPQSPEVDLGHVRENIRLAAATTAHLEKLADDLGLERPRSILSLADLANRMISLRLAPGTHPVPGDERSSLLRAAVRAARRRFDFRLPKKLIAVGWFAAMAVAPRGLARRLAELFLFPQLRRPMNSLLGRLQETRSLSK